MDVGDYQSLWHPGKFPSGDDEKKAALELSETADTRSQCLTELKQMIQEQSSTDLGKAILKEFENNDDAYLLCFLRARKFDVPRTYNLMKGW